MAADISDKVLKIMEKAKDDVERKIFQDSALAQVSREYQQMDGWKGLRLQTVTFYSGGKFSIYGYKRYNDIRLVMIPETDLGFLEAIRTILLFQDIPLIVPFGGLMMRMGTL